MTENTSFQRAYSNIVWWSNRSGIVWRWTVTADKDVVKGWALSRRSAMRQVEQGLRMFALMAQAVGTMINAD